MKTITHDLYPSRTHARRFYRLTPVSSVSADAYLVIQQGEVGPRGGVSKLDVEAYFVQVELMEPHFARVGWTRFLLAKDDDADPQVYEVTVPPRGTAGCCTCDGYAASRTCKHLDAMEHARLVAGWGMTCVG